MDDYPKVKVFVNKTGEQYFFWCAFCNRFHYHGSYEGHVLPHCINQKSPYLDTGYILKKYTKQELRELGLPLDYYEKRQRRNKYCR